MTNYELNKWWSSLQVTEKERIASKILTKESGIKTTVVYPVCTKVWEELNVDRKNNVYRHCTDNHGLLLQEYKEGKTMSY